MLFKSRRDGSSLTASTLRSKIVLVAVVLTALYPVSSHAQDPTAPPATCSDTAGAPVGLSAAVAGSMVTLTWSTAAGCAPTSHAIEVGSTPGASNVARFDTGLAQTNIAAGGVPPGLYYIRVRARDTAGLSAPSNEVSFTVSGLAPLVPGPPTNLNAETSGQSVVITWGAPGAGGALSSYVLEAGSASGLSNIAVVTLPSTQLSVAASGVPPGTYYLRVRARNQFGDGPTSNEVVMSVSIFTSAIRRFEIPIGMATIVDAKLSGDGSVAGAVLATTPSWTHVALALYDTASGALSRIDAPDGANLQLALSTTGGAALIGVWGSPSPIPRGVYQWNRATGIVSATPTPFTSFPTDYAWVSGGSLRYVLGQRGLAFPELVVLDRQTGTVSYPSRPLSGGNPNDDAHWGDITDDGRVVAFASYASNLVPGDFAGHADVFVSDRSAGALTRVSTGMNGAEANGASSCFEGCLSSDGRFVAFSSVADNLVPNDINGLSDVFLYDRMTATTTLISKTVAGNSGNLASSTVKISGNGRWVAFTSSATDLVATDTNGVADVFIFDRMSGGIRRISQALDGSNANGPSSVMSISDDGRLVLIRSTANNLDPQDINNRQDFFVVDLRAIGIVP